MESPPSPPTEVELNSTRAALGTVSRILAAKGEALMLLSRQFDTPLAEGGVAIQQFERALSIMRQSVAGGGKLVYTGMGKSFKIASKIVATLRSFSIPAAELHPSDALHGDMGVLTSADVLVTISASGNSPELAVLLNHTPPGIPMICLTCEPDSPLARAASAVIAAPLPAHLRESSLYGLPAPTITTTLCLAMGDALSVALYECLELEPKHRQYEFLRCHPGGAIGAAVAEPPQVVPWTMVSCLETPLVECSEVDLWRGAALAPVICANGVVYRSADLIVSLENKRPLALMTGVPLSEAPSTQGKGLCVFRDAKNQPTKVIWE